MNLFESKKTDASLNRRTAQDFINVTGVNGRILYTKDKNIFTYALLKSNDLSLMTKKEQKRFIDDICRALVTEKKPFKLLIMPRSIDISRMLDTLISLKNSTSNPIRLQLLRKEMDYISTFTGRDSDIRECACYLVMWEPQRKGSEKELLKRMDIVITELQKINLQALPLDKKEIAFMCTLFAKPQYTHDFYEEDLESAVPMLESTAKSIKGKPLEDNTLINLITPACLTFLKSSVELGDTRGSIYGAYKFPQKVEYAWIADVIREKNAITTITYYPDGSLLERVSDSVKESREKANNAKTALEYSRANRAEECAIDLVNKIDANNVSIGLISILTLPLCSKLDDDEQMQEAERSVKSAYMRNSIKLLRLSREQESAFKALSPYYTNQEETDIMLKRIMPLSTVIGGFPFASSGFVDDTGSYWGLNSEKGLMALDTWCRGGDRTNSCFAVLGKSGTGKSTFIKNLILTEFMRGTKILIIDPEGEYSEITKRLGGQVLNAAGGAGARSNPLEFKAAPKLDEEEDEDGEDIYKGAVGALALHLKTLEVFCKLYKPSMTESQSDLLKKSFIELYLQFGITWDTDVSKLKSTDYPIFSDLLKLLTTKAEDKKNSYKSDYEQLLLYFTDISQGGDSFIWNGHSTIKADSNVICFNTNTLQGVSANIKGAQYYNLTTWCWNEMTKNDDKVLLICDEAHLMIDKRVPDALYFLKSTVKRCRKFKSGLVVASHSVVDFLAEEIKAAGQALLDQPCYKVLFGTDGQNLVETAELFHLTNPQIELLEKQEIGVGITIVGRNKMKTFFEFPEYKFEYMGIKKIIGGDVGTKKQREVL